MKINQIYTKCLAQGAYYLSHNGEAAIIDPLREVEPYINRAIEDNATIKYIFETHFHADFVSGHVTLAEETGATIVFGPLASTKFKAHIAEDGEEFLIGGVTLKALHTPGHTMESTTFLLLDENGKEQAIFTGDTLFLGDVGRPDLAQKAANLTQEELAGVLFDSLRNKIMPLPDDITVYPAHGAGSACGKHMMEKTSDSLGNQKKYNYALREDMSRDEFIKAVTEGLLPPPGYFPLNVQLNKEGYEHIGDILEKNTKGLSPSEFKNIAHKQGALILDIRHESEFAMGHITNSLFIGLDGNFAPWVGEIIVDIQKPLLLVVSEGRQIEAVTRLSRVGFDKVLGYLDGGIDAWEEAGFDLQTVESIPAEELVSIHSKNNDIHILDVRRQSEYESEHILNANNLPLSELTNKLDTLKSNDKMYIHCKGGYRSMIVASMLQSNGINNFVDIQGGFSSIKETTIPTT